MKMLIVVAVLALSGAACSGGSPDSASLLGSWDVNRVAAASGTLEPPLPGTTLTATITETEINGESGCNSYMGAAIVDGSSVRFGPLVGTLMACADAAVMHQERAFTTLLQSVDSWQRTTDGIDLIADGITVVELVEADADLAGSSWNVVAINNQKGGVQSIVADSGPSLVFDEDHGVSGSTGCNNYFGTYSSDGDTLTFSGLGATEAYCQDTSEQERWLLTALRNAATYTVDSRKLELFDANGSRLLTATR